MNKKLFSYLPPARITEMRYWSQFVDQPWFKALRNQRRLSAIRLKEELADAARESRYEDPEKVVAYYKKNYALERDSRWVPRSRRDYPNL